LKDKVYIETSVISYLTARPSNDIRAMANQNVTIEWWETQRSNYDIFISEFVVAEASLGHPDAINRRLAIIADITELQATEEVRVLGQELIRRHALPANAKSGKKLVSFEHRKAVLSEVIAKQERPISDLHT